ncbi:MAG: hypothetical protein ACRDQ2_12215 [Gaiellales bacterium]
MPVRSRPTGPTGGDLLEGLTEGTASGVQQRLVAGRVGHQGGPHDAPVVAGERHDGRTAGADRSDDCIEVGGFVGAG